MTSSTITFARPASIIAKILESLLASSVMTCSKQYRTSEYATIRFVSSSVTS